MKPTTTRAEARTRVLVSATVVTILALVAAACSSDEGAAETPNVAPATVSPEATPAAPTATAEPPTPIAGDRAFYILPPGNFGGLPTTDESLDQLPLYDGLTPLRADITDADIDQYFLPFDFEPVGATTEEPTGRPGLTILYDEFGVPHITGDSREDVAFGAGWVTARDRALLFDLGRGPARVAVADVPGIDAFSLVTSAQAFEPSEATEQLVTDQVQLILDTYGEEGAEIIADAQAYADGINAYGEANSAQRSPVTVNDVIATTAFIGSIFGAGGGAEARNAEFLSSLERALGEEQGRLVWEDLLTTDDPEAPTTLEDRFDYGVTTGGEVTGSVTIDEGSVVPTDVLAAAEEEDEEISGTDGRSPGIAPDIVDATYDPVDGPIQRTASNWLTVEPEASSNGTTLAVMGPQLGYFYPEIVQQIRLRGPGIDAQGAAVPGLAMYLLIGRTQDYAWSLTSASQDVRDVYAEILCEPDGSEPTLASTHYEFDNECRPFEEFDAGTLAGTPVRYPVSVHGPVIARATSEGRPIALSTKRSTFGRDGLNLKALKDMTEGDADTPEAFYATADQFGFTFNWGYANREDIAYFASGLLPVRPAGLDRRLPTLGTGEYEWEGFLALEEHPHAAGHPDGRLLNWNNQSAPGFMHGDGTFYGSVHRVEAFDQWPDRIDLASVVGIMNRSATEDERSTVWPVISDVLAGSAAPSPLAEAAVALLDGWSTEDAPRLDADEDGFHDSAGPLLFDTLFGPIAEAVVAPVLGELMAEGIDPRGIDAASLIDKDLRGLLGQPVQGPFRVQYCGGGDLDRCRSSLWAAVDAALADVAATNSDDPSAWRSEADRQGFVPGLIPDDFRSTNRPTYQQVLEFAPAG